MNRTLYFNKIPILSKCFMNQSKFHISLEVTEEKNEKINFESYREFDNLLAIGNLKMGFYTHTFQGKSYIRSDFNIHGNMGEEKFNIFERCIYREKYVQQSIEYAMKCFQLKKHSDNVFVVSLHDKIDLCKNDNIKNIFIYDQRLNNKTIELFNKIRKIIYDTKNQ